MSRITYGRIRDCSELLRQVWTFSRWPGSVGDRTVWWVLDRYTLERRPSRRHKWKADRIYDRQDLAGPARESNMVLAAVPMPDEVRQYVHGEAVSRVAIGVLAEGESSVHRFFSEPTRQELQEMREAPATRRRADAARAGGHT